MYFFVIISCLPKQTEESFTRSYMEVWKQLWEWSSSLQQIEMI